MNTEDQHDTDPVKDPLKELADDAAGKTIAAIYAAWQGGEMQFGLPVFHDTTNIKSWKPNVGVSNALDQFARRVPLYLAASVFESGQPVPYQLYGVSFKDVPGGGNHDRHGRKYKLGTRATPK